MRINGLQRSNRLPNVNATNRSAAQTYHLAKIACRNQLNRCRPKTCTQDTIERRRRATALNVSQHGYSHLTAAGRSNCLPNYGSRNSRPRLPAPLLDKFGTEMFGNFDSFGDNDDRKALTFFVAFTNDLTDFVNIKGNLGNQDHLRCSGNTCLECDPSHITAHHFNQHDAVVSLRRGVNLVNCVGCRMQGGIEAKSYVC